MESEYRPIPQETQSATPEFIQECFDMKEAIDGHVNHWYEQAKGFHPGTIGKFSGIINTDCKDIEEPVENMVTAARFERRLTAENAAALYEHLERQKLVSIPANDSSLDLMDIQHEKAAEFFALIKEVRDHPDANPVFATAFDHLYRLFVKREQLAKSLEPNDDFETALEFSAILHRVLDERYLSAR